jgi:hypothetical protein
LISRDGSDAITNAGRINPAAPATAIVANTRRRVCGNVIPSLPDSALFALRSWRAHRI